MVSLDRIANLSTIAVCLVIGISVAQRWWRADPRSEPGYKAGDVIKNTPALALTSARQTLLVGTVSNCRYCTASMPFLQKLVEAMHATGGRLVAVTSEDLTVNQAYLRKHGVEPDAVVTAQSNGVALRATPLFVLVDAEGRVIGAWRGKQTPDGESGVFSAIRKGGRS